MTGASEISILAPDERPAAEVLNRTGRSPICLVCEHASAFVPSSLDALGLDANDRYSHAVWDIGALDLARRLAGALDAPLVASRVSRLVYDCNRPPEAADAIPARTERIEIPGNRDLTAAQRAARVREVYDPFRNLLSATLDRFPEPPRIVTIHSFTPTWLGVPRAVEIGILHDADDRLAQRMFAARDPAVRIELNAPYSARDGVTHTLALHALPRGAENVMIEVRNDLLSDETGLDRVKGILEAMLRTAMAEAAPQA